MSSAQQREIEEPEATAASRKRADLQSLLREMHTAKVSNLNSLHGRGTVLMGEGEQARGIHILRSGRATISISSSEGRVVMLRLAQAGDVLGLNSALRDFPYDTTVKAVEPCRTDFISRADLMDLIARSQTATYALLRIMSQELADITERTRSLLLPRTAAGRLAKLLFDWSKDIKSDRAQGVRIDRLFTHEEIAQMICSSRETVTRLLATFSKREIIEVSSDSLVIRDLQALERIARE